MHRHLAGEDNLTEMEKRCEGGILLAVIFIAKGASIGRIWRRYSCSPQVTLPDWP